MPNYNLLILKKTEKIVIAIYLITQFLNDKESLKKDLRSSANKLLENLNSLGFSHNKDVFLIYENSLNISTLIISYLTIARDTSLISKMNTNIVIEAMQILENLLAKKVFALKEEHLLINEEESLLSLLSLDTSQPTNSITSFDTVSLKNQKLEKENGKKEVKEKSLSLKPVISLNDNFKKKASTLNDNKSLKQVLNDISKLNKESKIENKEEIKKPILASKTEATAKKAPKNQARKDNRREQILSLFTRGAEVSVNDISKKIVGCSVKTIQRELNELMDENKIEKIGDKRWAKYILL